MMPFGGLGTLSGSEWELGSKSGLVGIEVVVTDASCFEDFEIRNFFF